MTEEQFEKLEYFIDAKIANSKQLADCHEAINEIETRKELRRSFNLPEYRPNK